MTISLRETFYEIMVSNEEMEHKKEEFVKNAKRYLETNKEIKLPMQLFENIFNVNFHRDVSHPILYIVRKLKREGLRVTKVKNDYLVRIQKYKKKPKKNKE